jgi:hypothetical protein
VALKPKEPFVEGSPFMDAIRLFEAKLSERNRAKRLQLVQNVKGAEQ